MIYIFTIHALRVSCIITTNSSTISSYCYTYSYTISSYTSSINIRFMNTIYI